MSTDVSEVSAASIIALMKEAVHTSETSVDIQFRTRQYIPEDSELHTRRRENLKSHIIKTCSCYDYLCGSDCVIPRILNLDIKCELNGELYALSVFPGKIIQPFGRLMDFKPGLDELTKREEL
jgi:hypothetical protein